MSKYTTELRYIIESNIDIFPSVCPFSEMTTSEWAHFKDHFIKHYFVREIGTETVGLFKQRLDSKLTDLAEKYDSLLAVKHSELDFFSVDYTSTTNATNTNNGTSNKSGSVTNTNTGTSTTNDSASNSITNGGNTLSLHSDTPEGNVNINSNDYVSSIDKNIDATNSASNSNANSSSTNSGTSTQCYNNLLDTIVNSGVTNASTRVFGNVDGKNIDRLIKYKGAVLTIELDIIKDCNNLFMLVW